MAEDPILSFLGARRVQGGQWFPDGAVAACNVGVDVALSATLCLTPQQPLQHVVDAPRVELRTKKLHTIDWDTPVSLWNISALGATNTIPTNVVWRTNHVPRACQEQQEVADRIHEAVGAFKGGIQWLPPNASGRFRKPEYALRMDSQVSFLNPHWIRATALLNERNIMNGLVELPSGMCRSGDYYAVPPGHLFSHNMERLSHWEDFADKRVPRPIPMRWNDRLVCYLLSKEDVAGLVDHTLHTKRTQLDVRPLRALNFELGFAPNTPPPDSGRLNLDIALCYTTWQNVNVHDEAFIDALCPMLPRGLDGSIL